MKPKVFTPNFTSKSSGTGLGLAICANMLESMNGRIYFESVEGQGTDFFIELPLLRDDLVDENLEVVILE
jgi:signal transduction histidine kinase